MTKCCGTCAPDKLGRLSIEQPCCQQALLRLWRDEPQAMIDSIYRSIQARVGAEAAALARLEFERSEDRRADRRD